MGGFGGRDKVGFEEESVGSRFGFWGSGSGDSGGSGSEGGEGGNSKSKSSSSKVELLASSHSSSCGSGASISFAAVYVAGLLCHCLFLDSGMTIPKESKKKNGGVLFWREWEFESTILPFQYIMQTNKSRMSLTYAAYIVEKLN